MTRSANEVMVLAGKAARGAGAPPAQAAMFGAAAVWCLAQGHPVSLLDDALGALPRGPIIALPLTLAQISETAKEARASGMIEATPLARGYVATTAYKADIDSLGRVTMDLNQPRVRVVPQRIDLPADVYSRWSALAARLLVPESDASRLSGAGAGLTDND